MAKIITAKKLKLTIIAQDKQERDEKYKFIRDSQYARYLGLNTAMGILASAYLLSGRDIKSEMFKNAQRSLTNSNPIFDGINFGKGTDSKSAITQRVKKDFSTALKNGLAKGERSITNYKRDFPLLTRGRVLKFYYENDDVLIKWVNGITFKVVLGQRVNENTIELRHTLHKIINGEYKIGQSNLYFDKNNHLMLNLTISMDNDKTSDFIPGRVCGVDLGLKFPAYCCLNNETYIRQGIGNYNDFFKARTQMKERRRRLQRNLSSARGGKGRKKKLQALNSLKEKESNFAKTYNHMISHKIVQFAKRNKCEFIHLEKLDKNGLTHNVLSNWSYYDLQQKVEYKAKLEGIKVRYVKAQYTSQKCSKCGTIDSDNRQTQAEFKCVSCGFILNADWNSAINIARSTDFVK